MIRIFIVDDHQLVIEGLNTVLQKETNFKLAGNATNAIDCIFKTNTCDVILMDISLPDNSGIDLCREIKFQYPGIAVIALSTFAEGSYIQQMIDAGASGYLLKNADKQEIIEGIKTVAKGNTYFSFEAGKIYKAIKEKQTQTPVLSKREKEVLRLIGNGLTNTAIAEKLFISVDTVDTHRKNLYTKLKVNNTALLIRKAIENNYLTTN
jgi:DNA-binding NarL/FixJ family response regulator